MINRYFRHYNTFNKTLFPQVHRKKNKRSYWKALKKIRSARTTEAQLSKITYISPPPPPLKKAKHDKSEGLSL